MTDAAAPRLLSISHVALNVRDLERSVQWYVEVLGFAPLFPYDTEDFRRRVLLHPSGVAVALTRHEHPLADAAFDERRTGLDHLAFAVGSEEELASWVTRFDALGVTHSGLSITPRTGSALVSFKDPDGIALEMYVQVGLPSSDA